MGRGLRKTFCGENWQTHVRFGMLKLVSASHLLSLIGETNLWPPSQVSRCVAVVQLRLGNGCRNAAMAVFYVD